MNWQLEADGTRKCPTHNTSFPFGDVCPICVPEYLAPPDDELVDTRVIRALRVREADYRSIARRLHSIGLAMLEAKENVSGAVRVIAEGTRLSGRADATFDKYTNIERDRDLIEHDRQMAGLGVSSASGASH